MARAIGEAKPFAVSAAIMAWSALALAREVVLL